MPAMILMFFVLTSQIVFKTRNERSQEENSKVAGKVVKLKMTLK